MLAIDPRPFCLCGAREPARCLAKSGSRTPRHAPPPLDTQYVPAAKHLSPAHFYPISTKWRI